MAGFFEVALVAGPSVEGGILEGASEREGNRPGVGAGFDNGGEVVSGLFGGLTAREEDDTGEILGYVGAKDFGSGAGDLVGGGGFVVICAGENHVAF